LTIQLYSLSLFLPLCHELLSVFIMCHSSFFCVQKNECCRKVRLDVISAFQSNTCLHLFYVLFCFFVLSFPLYIAERRKQKKLFKRSFLCFSSVQSSKVCHNFTFFFLLGWNERACVDEYISYNIVQGEPTIVIPIINKKLFV